MPEIVAQRREGSNVTIHLYREDETAYCDRRRGFDDEREQINLDEDDIDSEFIIKDSNVIGKMCTNCRKSYQGVCHANEDDI